MEHAIIQQRVNCVFGDDHLITVEVGSDNTLRNVYTTCTGEAKEETEGLILLGTDPMKTCFGYMGAFIKHVNSDMSEYQQEFPKQYMGTILKLVGGQIRAKVQEKKQERAKLAAEEAERKANESIEGFVQDKFMEHVRNAIGSRSKRLLFIKEADGHYTANMKLQAGYRAPATTFKIADRVKGEWHVPRNIFSQDSEVFKIVSYYASNCDMCCKKGHSDHRHTTGHQRQVAKYTMIALQACSSEGMRITNSGLTDKKGNLVRFNYRANSKNLVGVRFVEPVWEEEESETA